MVLLSLLVAGAFGLCSCKDDGLAVGGKWTVPGGVAGLSEVWGQAASELEADLTGAELTSFLVRWSSDGTIRDLELRALTPAGSELAISAHTNPRSEELVVRAQLVDWSGESREAAIASVLAAADVLASIDAVTAEGLAAAASVTVADGDLLQLWLPERGWVDDAARHVTAGEAFPAASTDQGPSYWTIDAGVVAAVDGSTLLSSLQPADLLLFAKEDLGSGATQQENNSIAYLFVR